MLFRDRVDAPGAACANALPAAVVVAARLSAEHLTRRTGPVADVRSGSLWGYSVLPPVLPCGSQIARPGGHW
jgi:hypothetical protein